MKGWAETFVGQSELKSNRQLQLLVVFERNLVHRSRLVRGRGLDDREGRIQLYRQGRGQQCPKDR